MAYSSMRIENDGGLARLVFTQPERGNPIDSDFCSDFCDAANQLTSDPDVRAVLITAEGKNFSFGGDIAMFMMQLDSLPMQIRRWTADLHVGISRMQRMDAPIVVAVQGVCAGGMAATIAGADLIVAEKSARFVAAYTAIGYSCDAGSSITLTRRMGLSRARKYLLLNETLDAGTALAAGLADEVVEDGAAAARAEEIARQLASGPTKAFGEIRRLLASAASEPLDSQLEREAMALARIAGTHDAREGLTAFAEKRKARFEGR